MTKRTTILFDLDGTLINTNELIITSYLYTLDHYYPGTYKREDVYPFIGPSLADVFSGINKEKADEMIEMYRKHNFEHHDSLVTEFEGVFDTLKTLKDKGYKLAIVSTKIHHMVEKGLKFLHLDQFFSVIIGSDDVSKVKPDPEPIYKALEQLGSTPEEAIMVGDNSHDIEAGQNAGTLAVGVSWSLKGKEYLEKFHPDVILTEMSDLLQILEPKNA